MRNVVGSVRGIGEVGIVRDVKPSLLPPGVWSDGRNVRFESRRCYSMGGVEGVFDSAVTGLLSVGLVNSSSEEFILYSTGGKVYSYDGTTVNDITRVSGGDYSETADYPFDIQSFNGLGLLNQPGDVPQVWDSSVGTNPLTMLTNWNANWKCEILRQFKSFLIAMKITESSTYYPHKMRWSSPAEAGAVPSTWDDTDATNEAGQFSFPDTGYGELEGGMELGERFYVYKSGAIWVLDYVGGQLILNREPVVRGLGLFVPRSLSQVPNYKENRSAHFFAGEDNFYIMDGGVPAAMFEEVFANEIVGLRSGSYYQTRSFTVTHPRFNEVWFCTPEQGNDFANLAFCLNYRNGTHTIRELSGAAQIVTGFGLSYQPTDTSQPLSFSDGVYFSDGTGFANTELALPSSVILEASGVEENLFYLDQGNLDYDGGAFEAWIERQGLPAVMPDQRRPETTLVAYNVRKLVTGFVFKAYENTSAQVSFGVQETDGGSVSWSTPITTIPTQYIYKFPRPISGRIISVKIESVGGDELSFGGFDYEVTLLGEY